MDKHKRPARSDELKIFGTVAMTAELDGRQGRSPRFELESLLLRRLARELTQSQQTLLNLFVSSLVEACCAGSAGICLVDENSSKDTFRWVATHGQLDVFINKTIDKTEALFKKVLDQKCSQLFVRRPESTQHPASFGFQFNEMLLVPVSHDGQVIAVMWAVTHTAQKKFDFEDDRILQVLAEIASSAFQISNVSRRQGADEDVFGDSQKDLEEFFMQAPVPMVILQGPDHRFKLANPPYVRLVGRDVVGKTVKEAFPVGEADYYVPILDSVYKTGKPYLGRELSLELFDDSGCSLQMWIDVGYHPVRNARGDVKGIMAFVYDVSEQVRARKAIETNSRLAQAEREKLEAIFYGSESAMVLFRGPDLVYEMINDKYQDLVPGRDLLGKPLIEALPELADSAFPKTIRRVFETGLPVVTTEEKTLVLNPTTGQLETRYFDASFARINDADGRPTYVINHASDVTERVNARHELEKGKELISHTLSELEQEKLLRERFVATLTHDLRTPLTAAKLGAQLIIRNREASESIVRGAGRIVATVNRADDMVRNLLDANLIRAGQPLALSIEECELSRLAASMIEDLSSVYGDRFQLEGSQEPVQGHWNCDGVRRILENLCLNGIKYGDSEAPVQVIIQKNTAGVELLVHNKGPAIPKDEHANLFEPFRRSRSAKAGDQKGWGLGLTLVKGLTQAHGGEVGFESEEGSGTTFRVKLPLDARPFQMF